MAASPFGGGAKPSPSGGEKGDRGVLTVETMMSLRPALDVHGWLLDLDTRLVGGVGAMSRDGGEGVPLLKCYDNRCAKVITPTPPRTICTAAPVATPPHHRRCHR